MAVYEHIYTAFREGELAPLYETMYPSLIAFASRLLGEDFSFLAEDCVQDAVLNTYHQRSSFGDTMQWKVFLYTCVRNNAISVMRKGQAKRNYLSSAETEDEDFSLQFIEQETLTLLYHAIDSLPAEYRELLDMNFVKGMKIADIAAELNVAVVTVKKRKRRMLDLLRDSLGGDVDGDTLRGIISILLFV